MVNNMFIRAGAAHSAGAPIGAAWNVAQSTTSTRQASAAGAAFGLVGSGTGAWAGQIQPAQRTTLTPQNNIVGGIASGVASAAASPVGQATFGLLHALNTPVRKVGDFLETQVRYYNQNTGEGSTLGQRAKAGVAFLLPAASWFDQEWRDSWVAASEAQASPAQTLWLHGKSVMDPDDSAPADDPFRLLDEPTLRAERNEYFGGGAAKWTTGIADFAINIFADPLIVGGKVAQAGMSALKTIKATDVAAAASGTSNLTRGGRRVETMVNRVAQAFEDASGAPGELAALTKTPFLQQSSDAGAIAYFMRRIDAIEDPIERMAARKNALYAGMGHRPSLAKLEQSDELLSLELQSFLGPNRDEAVMHLLLRSDIEHIDNLRAAHEDDWLERVVDLHIKEVDMEREALRRVHAVGSPTGMAGERLGATQGVGELRELPLFVTVGRTVHKGLGLPPMHFLYGRKLPNVIDLGADDAYESFASAVMRTAGRFEKKSALDDEMKGLLDEFASTWSSVDAAAARIARRNVVDRFNKIQTDRIVNRLAGGKGPDAEKAVRSAIMEIRTKRNAEILHVQERAQRAFDAGQSHAWVSDPHSGVILFDPDIALARGVDPSLTPGKLATPFAGTQTDIMVSIPDYQAVEKALRTRFKDGWQGWMERKANGTWRFTEEALTAFDQLWKFAALARPGYPIRNFVDTQARNLAMLGALDVFHHFGKALGNFRYNLGKISVEDLGRLEKVGSYGNRLRQIDDLILARGVPSRSADDLLDEITRIRGEIAPSPAWDGGPDLFHGTSRAFVDDLVNPDPWGGSGAGNLFGYGFYTTHSRGAATGYMRKGRGGDPALYRVKWSGVGSPRVLDLEQPANEVIRNFVRAQVDSVDGLADEAAALLRRLDDPSARGRELLLDLRSYMAGSGMPRSTADDIYGDLAEMLSDSYDVLRHVGGLGQAGAKAANGAHQVNIFLNPRDVKVTRAGRSSDEGASAIRALEDELAQASSAEALIAQRADLEGAIKALMAELGQSASGKMVRRSGTPLARHIGMEGDRPAFRDAADFERAINIIDAKDSVTGLVAADASRLLGDLRSSGQWQYVGPTHVKWADSYLEMVNKRIRNDRGLMSMLAGADDATVRAFYLTDPEGRAIWNGLKSRYLSVDDFIATQRDQINQLVPEGRARDLVMGGNLSERMLDDIFPDTAIRPAVPREMLEGVAKSPFEAMVGYFNRTRAWWFKYAGEMPEEMLGRLPFYVSRKQAHLDRLWPRVDDGWVKLTAEELNELYLRAGKMARRDVGHYLFDTAQRSNLSAHLRFLSPFYNAWSDTMRKWMRIAGQNPASLPVLGKAMMAPNSLFSVVDKDGNQILVNGDVINENGEIIRRSSDPTEGYIVLPIPEWLGGKMGADNEVKIAKSALNVTFQGEPFWLPSAGPLVTVPVNEFSNKMFPDLVDNPIGRYLLPYGPEPASTSQVLPMWARNAASMTKAAQGTGGDSRVDQTYGTILATRAGEISRGEAEPMTQGELMDYAQNATRNWWIMRFMSNWLGFTAQPQSRMAFWQEEFRRYRREYGADASDRFYEDYPDYFEATISLSVNETGIAATDETWNATNRYSREIRHNPEYGWMYVGAANLAPGFSEGVYTAQQAAGFRTTKNPAQAYEDTQVSRGWREYTRFQNAVAEELAIREAAGGPKSLTALANQDIKAVRDRFIADLKASNMHWANQFEKGGTAASVNEFFRVAADAVADRPELGERSDFQALSEYIRMRNAVREELDARGLASLNSPGAEDVAEVWGRFTSDLVASDLGFEQMWNRAGLDRDIVAR